MKMSRVLIIAEVGVNHNGSLDLAIEMVHRAKEAGADIVKFQTAKAENVISRYAEKAEYQKATTGSDESQLDMVKKLMLSNEDFIAIKDYCEKCKIHFLSTPFDLSSVDFLKSLKMGMWKIPSGEITNLPYLIQIARTGEDIILSTGMSTMDEIKAAYSVLKDNGAGDITLLHCTTEYPAPFESVNLSAMITLRDVFGCKVGYSDHTSGIEIPVAAVAMGARVIEKHFTIDRNMEGPDHKASLEPYELKKMVEAIRNVESSMGDGIKVPSEAEKKNISIARKSIIAMKHIKKGETLTEENLTTKRPGSGISPMRWFDVLGTKAVRDFDEDELIEI